jgi:hypothetical protein
MRPFPALTLLKRLHALAAKRFPQLTFFSSSGQMPMLPTGSLPQDRAMTRSFNIRTDAVILKKVISVNN